MKKLRNQQLLESFIQQFHLEDVLLPEIREKLELHAFVDKELVCLQNNPAHFLYFLVEGELDISSGNEDGTTITITRIKPLASIGAMEYFSKVDYCQTVVAAQASTLIAIPIFLVEKELSANLAFHQLLCKHFSDRKLESSKKYARTLLYPAKTRLLVYLVKLATNEGHVIYKNQNVADALSISVRHLRRLLAQCEEEGLLKRSKKGILLDLEAIERTQVLL